jgi:hypothetical protein
MSKLIGDKSKKPKIRFTRRRGVTTMPEFIRVVEQLASAVGLEVEIEGTQRVRQVGGGGFKVDLTPATTSPSSEIAFTIRDDYSIVPGTINGTIMPLIGSTRLDASTPPTMTGVSTGTHYVFLKLEFTITMTDGYLSAWSLSQGNVTIHTSTSASPAQDNDTKYILIGTITNGVPSNTYANRSPIPVTLWDNGYDSTLLRVGNL